MTSVSNSTDSQTTGIKDRSCVNNSEYLKMLEDGGCPNVPCCCWWCTHEFDTLPVCAPTRYDPKRDIFKVHGIFCSFECAKAYLINRSSSYVDTGLVTLLNKRLTGQLMTVNSAPARQALQRFGGELSIEAFRTTRSTNRLHTIVNPQTMRYQPDRGAMKNHVSVPVAAHDILSEPATNPRKPKVKGLVVGTPSAGHTNVGPSKPYTPLMLDEGEHPRQAAPTAPLGPSLENWMGIVIRD